MAFKTSTCFVFYSEDGDWYYRLSGYIGDDPVLFNWIPFEETWGPFDSQAEAENHAHSHYDDIGAVLTSHSDRTLQELRGSMKYAYDPRDV